MYKTMWWVDDDFKDVMTAVDSWLSQRGDTINIVTTNHTTTAVHLDAPDKIHVIRKHYFSIVYTRRHA